MNSDMNSDMNSGNCRSRRNTNGRARGDRDNTVTSKQMNKEITDDDKGVQKHKNGGGSQNFKKSRKNPDENHSSHPMKRQFPIGYAQLEKANNTMEHSKLLLDLSSEEFFGFLTLLKQNSVEPKMMCLILSVLANVVNTPAESRDLLLYFLNKILPKSKDKNHFMKTALPIFIMQLSTYTNANNNERERYIQAILDLLKFLRKIQLILPQGSRNVIGDVTLGLQAQIEFINRKGNNCFTQETMTLLVEITESMNNFNVKNEAAEIATGIGEPPDDFRLIQICPNAEDILHNHEPYIRKNVVNGKYVGGVEHYLDVQFRLLREDFVRPLREGITEYLRLSQDTTKKHNWNKIKDVKVYNEVHVVSSVMRSGDLIYSARFNTAEFQKVRWQFSKRLITGSLVCLTPNEFKSFCFATITGRRDPDKLATGEFQLKFEFENHVTNNISPAVPLKMIESQVYFEAYRHNLQVLQNFDSETFPFKRYIINVNCEILPPSYVRNETKYNLSDLTRKLFSITLDEITTTLNDPLEMNDKKSVQQKIKSICARKMEKGDPMVAKRSNAVTILNDPTWPDRDDFGLDESQFLAFKAALTKEFVIIQGPPGTGKTYVGLRIVQALLQNISIWGKSRIGGMGVSPILIVCYTNHALDQFLEGILPFCQSIIRIGGKSRSPLLEQFNLSNVKMNQQEARRVPSYIYKNRMDSRRIMEKIQQNMCELEKSIETTTKDILGEELLSAILDFDEVQHNQLICSNGIVTFSKWLGYMNENKDFDTTDQFQYMDVDSDEEIIEFDDLESEIDADEEEIVEIENNRIIDDEFDYELDALVAPFNENRSLESTSYVPVEMMDGFQLQKHQKKRMKYQFKKQLKKTDAMTAVEAKAVKDIWVLSFQQRWNLYRFWRKLYVQGIEKDIQEQRKIYSEERVRFEALKKLEDLEIVKDHFIIGMTTTGAAKYHHIINGIKPRIIVVEEAAEVLESHIVTSLCSKTEHLILIGDHQQLKPSPAVYELAKKFNLEVSLFERMIQNGIACHQLKLQHRMRPNISELLVPHIYKELIDHDSVKFYEDIKGVTANLYFVNHGHFETKINDTMSCKNDYEAYFVVELCRYLILQGYQTSQVTILTSYSGQLYQMKSLMRKHEILNGVRATVVDNFQGEENDIIILTFVRSNMDGDIGFLKVSNRVNVALSRAKKGLYCIGNFDCLLERSPLWQKIIKKLKQQNAIGRTLNLYCQNHPETLTSVAKGEDFVKCPEGGCLKPCDARLSCGHVCPSACHISDSEHELAKCFKPCDKIVCEQEHRCKKKCHYGQECGPCVVMVQKLRSACGHFVKVKCSESSTNVFCDSPCDKKRTCGHKCQLSCGNNCESNPCLSFVQIKGKCNHTVKVHCSNLKDEHALFKSCKSPCNSILDCGHICAGTCGSCYRRRLHVECKAKCKRPLICGHVCNNKCATNCPPCTKPCPNICPHSKCKNKCGNPCAACQEPCKWVCEHKKCTKLCKENCDRDLCMEPCKNILKCNHPCIGICGEPCPKLCRICNKDEVQGIFFGDEDEPDARFMLLVDCNHIVEVNGLLNWIKKEEEKDSSESTNISIQMKVCPICKTVIRQTKALNTYIQRCLRDLEGVKVQTFGNMETNQQKQMALYETISNIHPDAAVWSEFKINAKLVRSTYDQLLRNTKPNNKGIGLSENDICKQQNIFQIWTNIVEVLKTYLVARKGTHKNIDASVLEQLELRAFHLLNFMSSFTNNKQEMDDVRREIVFLQMTSDVAKDANMHFFNEQGRVILRSAFEMTLNSDRFTEIVQDNFKKMVIEATKQQSGIGITLEEKNMVLKAMAFSKGHWYKCPNGHIYCIADCGGAVMESKCPDCGSTIGGQSHSLRSDNALATEMDGATQSAWPTNLINHLQPFMD